MTEKDVYDALNEIFQDVFKDPVVLTPALSAKDVEEWDSYKQIEIIMAAEERFSIKLSTRELDNLQCVGDLVSVILLKAGGRA